MITGASFLGLPLRTPLQRRLLVVLYYAIVFGSAMFGFTHTRHLALALLSQAFWFAILLGGIRAGGPVKAYERPVFPLDSGDTQQPITLGLLHYAKDGILGAREWTPLDERETEQRNRAHFQSYRILRWVMTLAIGVYWLSVGRPQAMLHAQAPMLLWLLLVFTLSLPQCVLLWSEPASTEETEPAALPA